MREHRGDPAIMLKGTVVRLGCSHVLVFEKHGQHLRTQTAGQRCGQRVTSRGGGRVSALTGRPCRICAVIEQSREGLLDRRIHRGFTRYLILRVQALQQGRDRIPDGGICGCCRGASGSRCRRRRTC